MYLYIVFLYPLKETKNTNYSLPKKFYVVQRPVFKTYFSMLLLLKIRSRKLTNKIKPDAFINNQKYLH